MPKIDYQKINVEEFLNELGLRNVRRDGWEVFFSCPFDGHSHGDSNPSASMQQGSTKVHCFGCGFSGNALIFLAEYENCSPLRAAHYIRQWLGDEFEEPKESLAKEIDNFFAPKKKIDRVRNQVLDKFELKARKVDWRKEWQQYTSGGDVKPYSTYLFDRGFLWDTLCDFSIGWDTVSERITIPYFDEEHRLIGFKGRALPEDIGDGNARYKVIGGSEYGFDTFDVSMCLFGIDKLQDWEQKSYLIVVEGELNLMRLYEAGIGPAVGISGMHLSDSQAYMIEKIGKIPVLYFDRTDDARKAAEKLVMHIPTRIVPDHDKDAADSTGSEIRNLIQRAESAIL